jgi:hypothetical protein
MAIKLKDLPAVLVRNYIAGVNTFIRGKPAIGKTHTINAFVDQMKKKIPDFGCWLFYAPTMSPMDIQASAPNYETGKLSLYNNAALPNAYETPDAKGVMFLGELPNTDPATAKLLQKYINGEDMSGVLRKPDGVIVIADGNRIEDKSSVQQQGRAFMSRFEQLEAYTEATDNAEYAAKEAWHPFVQTFFKDNPALIDNYDDVFETSASARARSKDARNANGSNDQQSEEGKLGIWANMRSWERISRKEYAADELRSPVTLTEAAGNLGAGVAAQYEAHKKILNGLTSFDDIMADPENAKMPKAMDETYQLAMLVALRCKEDQIEQVRLFGMRMAPELQAVILRTMAKRKGFNLSASPAYLTWISNKELTSLLNGR